VGWQYSRSPTGMYFLHCILLFGLLLGEGIGALNVPRGQGWDYMHAQSMKPTPTQPDCISAASTVSSSSSSSFSSTSASASSGPSAESINYQQKYEWFVRFANAFMYPNNTVQAATINSTLFSEDVQGRVDETSTFDGRELNTEVGTLTHRL
jgi:hypothetical protein